MIEVELRGLLDKSSYHKLLTFFDCEACNIECDNKTADYYYYDDGILKVVDEHSKGKAKLSLKVGDEFSGLGTQEHDVYLKSSDDIVACRIVLGNLGYRIKSTVNQTRKNYTYSGVEFSVKHTNDWGYHFEAELVVESQFEVLEARNKIEDVCHHLGIEVMTSDDLRKFV